MGEENASDTPFLFLPITTKNWHKRCETAGAANLRASSNSAIRNSCRKSPIRMRDETFDRSKPVADAGDAETADKIFTRRLLTLRRENICPAP